MQESFLGGSPGSDRGIAANINGSSFAASIEGGYPITIASRLTVEPQVQAIWQHLSIDGTHDAFSSINFQQSTVFTGRVGVRLEGAFGTVVAVWRPYLKANVWWNPRGVDAVTFASDVITTSRNNGPAVEVGAGANGKLTQFTSIYGDVSYLGSVAGEKLATIRGNVGVRVTW
jgi:outer membrane autotransporter protein